MSDLYILWFDWLISLYILTPLTSNASLAIVKHRCIRGELSSVTMSWGHRTWLILRAIPFKYYSLWPVFTHSLHLSLSPFSTCGVRWGTWTVGVIERRLVTIKQVFWSWQNNWKQFKCHIIPKALSKIRKHLELSQSLLLINKCRYI